jgi:hypothetical protein
MPKMNLNYTLSIIMADRLLLFGRTFIVYFLHPTKNISTQFKMQLCLLLKVFVLLNFKKIKGSNLKTEEKSSVYFP